MYLFVSLLISCFRTTSDCELVKKKSVSKYNFAELNYGTTCFTEPHSTWNSQPLTPKNLMRSLPDNYHHPTNKVTLTYIHIIKKALISQNGDVYTGNHKIVGHGCQEDPEVTPVFPELKLQEQTEINDEVFAISQYWGYGYFHNMVECLPRMVPFVQFLKDNPQIKIHIYGLSQRYIRELLEHFDIPEERFIFGLIRARILYLPQSGPCAGAVVFNERMQSMVHRSKITVPPQPRRSIVLIKRSEKRFFKNHDSIVKALVNVAKDYGDYDVEVFSDTRLPTMAETMAMFNRAFMVVAPHGAGESNLHFSESGTILIEGLCHPPNLCYRNHMHALGHRYYGLYFEGRNCFDVTPEDILSPVIKYLDIIQKLTVITDKHTTRYQ